MIQPCLQWLAINASTRNTFIDSLITIGRPYNFPWPLSYPADAMENNLDWINVMAFDFGAPTWKPNLTEAPAALYNPFSEVSGDSGISSWIRAGFLARKIVFGLPYYGYAWKLKDANNHGFLALANGADITADGALGYTHIRIRIIGQGGAITAFNYTFASDYCYNGTTWVGYDDVKKYSG